MISNHLLQLLNYCGLKPQNGQYLVDNLYQSCCKQCYRRWVHFFVSYNRKLGSDQLSCVVIIFSRTTGVSHASSITKLHYFCVTMWRDVNPNYRSRNRTSVLWRLWTYVNRLLVCDIIQIKSRSGARSRRPLWLIFGAPFTSMDK